MEAGYKLQDGGRIDVATDKSARRVRLTLARERDRDAGVSHVQEEFALTISEARAVASALMGASAEA